MLVTVTTPRELTRFTEGRHEFTVNVAAASAVGDAVEEVFALCPELRSRVLDEQGQLFPHLKLLLNQQVVKWSVGTARAVSEGDEIELFSFASGG